MSEDPIVFQGYTEKPAERDRVLGLYDPDARAIIEAYLGEHPGMLAKEAANATLAIAGTAWWLS